MYTQIAIRASTKSGFTLAIQTVHLYIFHKRHIPVEEQQAKKTTCPVRVAQDGAVLPIMVETERHEHKRIFGGKFERDIY